MHPIAKKAHRQEDEDHLQPKRAKLSGCGKDQLASEDVLSAKYQDWQNDHRSCWTGNIEIHNIRDDIPTEYRALRNRIFVRIDPFQQNYRNNKEQPVPFG